MIGTEAAYAKVNLGLDILGTRSDGYHEMRMVMQAVSLCDMVTVESNTGDFALRMEGFTPPEGKKTLEQQAAEGTLPPVGAVAEEAADEEEFKGGKGRTFLKVFLVILVMLLVIEVAGIAVKIAAPTSGAAEFIDNQLHKVFQLFGDEDTNPENYNA
jgi:hypothetical protein